ncbi:MAG: cyclic-di-AMP receptor [Chloroflexia bacterium]
MKLVLVVISNAQADETVEALLQKGHRVTRMSSTGGLLRQGNTTLLIGAQDADVDSVREIVQQHAPGALWIVLPLERYERF